MMTSDGNLCDGMVFVAFKTTENRTAHKGEWYLAGGNVVKCEAECTNREVAILFCRPYPEAELLHIGDPCEWCGTAKNELQEGQQRCCVRMEKENIVFAEETP